MSISRARLARLAVPLVVLFVSAVPLHAELPPLSAADREATAPASDPQASTIVLFKRAVLQLRDLKRQQASSNLHLEQRIKVLTQEGLHGGEIELAHGRDFRLQSLQGRTILPDGRTLPVANDARFERRLSSKSHTWVTAVSFPGVQVGAIIELEADFYFDSFLFLEPWYLSDSVPVRYSEVAYEVPKNIVARGWGRDPFQAGLQTEQSQTVQGVRLRAWAKDLPAVPSEPFGPPFADMATQYGLVVTAWQNEYVLQRFFESWESTCEMLDGVYSPARHDDSHVKAKARELAGSLRDPRAKAEALYQFVRDQIRTDRKAGVGLPEGSTLDKVLAGGSGTFAEKALLLQDMLDRVRVDSKLVWANERSTGAPPISVPNPIWFERVLVAVELPGSTVYLDPAEPALPFGDLLADVEGSPALLFDLRKPEVITLPMLPPEANRREATLKLAVDDDGGASGSGELRLTGQHAIEALTESDATKLVDTWTQWLEAHFPGFVVRDVTAAATSDGRELHVGWAMALRDAEVLGDELTLLPSRPLGVAGQPLGLSPALRRTPILLPFADSDEVSLDVTLPAAWQVESMPETFETKNGGGALSIRSELDAEHHALHYQRRLDVASRVAADREAVKQLYGLFEEAAKQDAKALALARR